MDNELKVWNVTEQLLSSRVVKIYSEINQQVAYETNALLDVLSYNDPTAIIKLEICTPGGEVLNGLSIVDKIQEIPNPVIAFNTGHSCSMGTAILSACDYAFGSENCSFMIHELSSGTSGKFRDMENAIKFNKELNERLMELIARKCKKTPKQIMDDAVRDLWLDAKAALDYGLIDAITPKPKKDVKILNDFIKELNKSGK